MNKQTNKIPNRLNVKYFFTVMLPVGCVVAFFWLITRLPYRAQLKLGQLMGRGLYYLDKKGKRTARINLQLCFPEKTPEVHEQLLKTNYQSVGMGMIEMAWMSCHPPKTLASYMHIHGQEHIDNALNEKRGVILASVHFTCMQLVAYFSSYLYRSHTVYRPHKKAWMNHLLEKHVYKHFSHVITRHNVRQMARVLKQNQVLCLAIDLDVGRQSHVMAPFFNIPTATTPAPSMLAKLSNAAVLFTSCYRRKDGNGYNVFVHPPLDHFPSDDNLQDAARLNELAEQAIRHDPTQYLWQYKRFKTRPEGEKRFY